MPTWPTGFHEFLRFSMVGDGGWNHESNGYLFSSKLGVFLPFFCQAKLLRYLFFSIFYIFICEVF